MSEKKLRRTLNKHGYSLHKSRSRISINNLGGYQIIDSAFNAVVGGSRFDMSLHDVSEFAKMYCTE